MNNNKIVKIEDDILLNNKEKSISKSMKNYLKKIVGEAYTIIESGQKVNIGKDFPLEYSYSKYTYSISNDLKIAKSRAATNIKSLIENATNRKWEKNKHQKHNIDSKYGFYKYDTVFSLIHNDKEKIYKGILVIRNDADGKKYLYDLISLKQIKKLTILPSVASNNKCLAIFDGSSNQSIDNIAYFTNNVNYGDNCINVTVTEDTKYYYGSLNDNLDEFLFYYQYVF